VPIPIATTFLYYQATKKWLNLMAMAGAQGAEEACLNKTLPCLLGLSFFWLCFLSHLCFRSEVINNPYL
jgi:hypothetical protein